jgi:NAD(P)-dependent dehydrogenase (short-subunit alcohol dehydrogenase family)
MLTGLMFDIFVFVRGPIDTPMLRRTVDAESRKTMAAGLPIERLGESEEVAYLASFLISDQSKFITGTTQMIDGGQGCV